MPNNFNNDPDYLDNLNSNINSYNPILEEEIPIEELMFNWYKTNKIILKENIGTRLDLGKDFDDYAKTLTLFKQ